MPDDVAAGTGIESRLVVTADLLGLLEVSPGELLPVSPVSPVTRLVVA
ncbi:hypothetical protein Daura_12345 [Dactylosporangium aurantiacum]|uniref:Uncharacterized protein n=1 Tax=Dactylosporangium aurantiacum TaxID=35754 RepID=A0A9Q9MJG1_9ACTN|nr:hypothetical protein [Dactylosporangium aurantiacum]MDG6104096.1 hypothetical protein [Dactylosporangium aurantiacum]UWZ56890.1 hypothetical protein Daura_12345 [Dactylosporangium aurantiacum]